MRKLINFICIAMYTIVAYFATLFIIHSFSNADTMLGLVEILLTTAVILAVTILAGFFCYKIITTDDTM